MSKILIVVIIAAVSLVYLDGFMQQGKACCCDNCKCHEKCNECGFGHVFAFTESDNYAAGDINTPAFHKIEEPVAEEAVRLIFRPPCLV